MSVDVIRRVLVALHESGPMKRTNLSGKSGLNYDKCIKYVNLMQRFGWVEIIPDAGHHVNITEKGINTIEILSDFH